jgi:hypothetical protein
MVVNREVLEEEMMTEEVLTPEVVAVSLSMEWVLRVEDVEEVLLLCIDGGGEAWQCEGGAKWRRPSSAWSMSEDRARAPT